MERVDTLQIGTNRSRRPQSLDRCIIPLCVPYKTTDQTFMSSGTQHLFEQFPTPGAILTRVFQSNGNRRDSEYLAPRLQPLKECRSRPIRDRFRPLAVGNPKGQQQIPRGSPVARLDLALKWAQGQNLPLSAEFDEVFSTFLPTGSGLESQYRIQSQEPETRFLALSNWLQIFSKNPVSNPDFTLAEGLSVRPFRGCGTLKMHGFERRLPQIQVIKIFNNLTRRLGVELIPSHLPPQDLNPGHSLGEAIGIETGVKLRVKPLGRKKKLWGEDRTLGAQFRVISLVVFQSVSDATIADHSWRGPFSRPFCTKDPPL